MKLNGNQIITGMYVYSPDCEYTVNDFVVEGGVIYICTKDSRGKNPGETPDSFKVYLGDKGKAITFSEYQEYLEDSSSFEDIYLEDRRTAFGEYLDFLETSEGANKYLSVGMLQAIMSYYLLGTSGKGIIGDYICYNQDGLQVSLRTKDSGTFTDPDTIISEIMFHPNINHAILRVSRLLPEINGYVGSQGISDYSEEDQKSVILRQYTYLQEGTGNRIRLQELIDPIDGVIWYRSGNMDTKFMMASGNWKCSVVNSRPLKLKIENIIGVYTSRLKVLKSLETHLKSNFRYRKLELFGNGEKPTSVYFEGIDDPEITITVSELTSEGYVRNYETTINLGDRINEKIPSYLIGDKYKIDISSDQNRYSLALVGSEGWFSGAYYKEYYGLS